MLCNITLPRTTFVITVSIPRLPRHYFQMLRWRRAPMLRVAQAIRYCSRL